MGVAEAIGRIRRQIERAAVAARRDPETVTLVAVSKGYAAELVAGAAGAGVHDFGENRVAEAGLKSQLLPSSLSWHLLGHLQGNKAKAAAQLFRVFHALDSVAIAEALACHWPANSPPLGVLLQVDFTSIQGRTGLREDDVLGVLAAAGRLPQLAVRGLMTMAPPGGDEVARPYFRRLRGLRDRLEQEAGVALPDLSMGMSDDFTSAIEEGATMVRIGRAIFGARG